MIPIFGYLTKQPPKQLRSEETTVKTRYRWFVGQHEQDTIQICNTTDQNK